MKGILSEYGGMVVVLIVSSIMLSFVLYFFMPTVFSTAKIESPKTAGAIDGKLQKIVDAGKAPVFTGVDNITIKVNYDSVDGGAFFTKNDALFGVGVTEFSTIDGVSFTEVTGDSSAIEVYPFDSDESAVDADKFTRIDASFYDEVGKKILVTAPGRVTLKYRYEDANGLFVTKIIILLIDYLDAGVNRQ